MVNEINQGQKEKSCMLMLCELYKSQMHRNRTKCWLLKVWKMEELGVNGQRIQTFGWVRGTSLRDQLCIMVRTISNNILVTRKLLKGQIIIIVFIVYFMLVMMGSHYDIHIGFEVLNSSNPFPSTSLLVGLQECITFVSRH